MLDGYGYLWYVGNPTHSDEEVYFAWGTNGQLITVFPARDMVLVSTAYSTEATWPMGGLMASNALRNAIANLDNAVEAVSCEDKKGAGEDCSTDHQCESGTCVTAHQRQLLFASMPPGGVCM